MTHSGVHLNEASQCTSLRRPSIWCTLFGSRMQGYYAGILVHHARPSADVHHPDISPEIMMYIVNTSSSYKKIEREKSLWRNDSTCTHTNPMQPASHRDCHTRTDPVHTHNATSTATNRALYTFPIMTSALALQTSIANPAPTR